MVMGAEVSRPKVFVTFHGIIHSEYNAQFRSNLGISLDIRFAQPSGRKTVFLENSNSSEEDDISTRKILEEYGPLGFIIFSDLSRRSKKRATREEVERHRQGLAGINIETDLQVALERGLIPEDGIRDYFRYTKLEELVSGNGVDIRYEYHPKGRSNQIKEIQKSYLSLQNSWLDAWDEGSFAASLINYRRFRNAVAQVARLRDEDLDNILTRHLRALMATNEGGNLFILFGSSHASLVETIQRRLSNKSGVVDFQIGNFIPDGLPDQEISIALKKGKTVSDLLSARGLFLNYAVASIQEMVKGNIPDVVTYAYHFEDIVSALTEGVLNFSLDDLRRMCTERNNPMFYLRELQGIKRYFPDITIASS